MHAYRPILDACGGGLAGSRAVRAVVRAVNTATPRRREARAARPKAAQPLQQTPHMALRYTHLRRRLRLPQPHGLAPTENRQTLQFPCRHRPNLPCHGISWPKGRV